MTEDKKEKINNSINTALYIISVGKHFLKGIDANGSTKQFDEANKILNDFKDIINGETKKE